MWRLQARESRGVFGDWGCPAWLEAGLPEDAGKISGVEDAWGLGPEGCGALQHSWQASDTIRVCFWKGLLWAP